MKKLYALLLVLSVSVHPARSQWEWQNPLPQGNTLSSVFFTSASAGYACGWGSTILKTTDHGDSWTSVQTPVPVKFFNSVCFTDDLTGYIAGGYSNPLIGDTGIILRTTDGGVTWDDITPGYPKTLEAICFPTHDTGYTVGYNGMVLRTADGGNSWTNVSAASSYSFTTVFFTDGHTGYAGGYTGVILKTTDAGASWHPLATGTTQWIRGLWFTDENTGHAVGYTGTRIKTTDGGITWTPHADTAANSYYSVCFDTPDHGIAVAWSNSGGIISRTSDGGETWVNDNFNPDRAVTCAGSSYWYAAGFAGKIARSQDGGITWNMLSEGNANNLYDICFPDAMTGYAAGTSGTVLKTTDAGDTWEEKNLPETDTLYGVSFTNTMTGYTCGLSGKIFKTTNGGNSWAPLNSGTTAHLSGIDFPSADTGFITGPKGKILATTDGNTWTERTVLSSTTFQSVDFLNPLVGYVAGGDFWYDTGVVARTDDGGYTWEPRGSGFTHYLIRLFMVTPSYGFAISNQSVYRTNDGFATITETPLPGLSNDIFFTDSLTGYIISSQYKVFKTNDGGNTWNTYYTGSSDFQFALCFTDSDHGFISGELGTILTIGNATVLSPDDHENAGGTGVSINAWPNPFRNNLTIDIKLPASELPGITIFDETGRKVRRMDGGRKTEDGRRILWDGKSDGGASVPPGIYFIVSENNGKRSYKTIIKQ